MVRNLYMEKRRLLRPYRSWTKITGPGLVSLIAIRYDEHQLAQSRSGQR